MLASDTGVVPVPTVVPSKAVPVAAAPLVTARPVTVSVVRSRATAVLAIASIASGMVAPMQAHHVNPITGEDELSLAPAQIAAQAAMAASSVSVIGNALRLRTATI